ncbi:DUF2808 domain-containing protein [Pleurocapsales cyanobacterium LEGE 06147]|nr:DUF2808 domain-containing protein [Pleurocapsales cyanobacterium LEGE 06147]
MKISAPLLKFLGTGLISCTLLLGYYPMTAAMPLAQQRSFFRKSPRLLNATTTFSSVRAWGATYYFTIQLPHDAGDSLGKIAIAQRQAPDEISFYLDRTVAFEGTHRRKGETLNIESVTQDEQTGTIAVTFVPPIPAGTTLTVGLRPKRNPDYSGVYLFGVTTVPAGKNPHSLYLGVGRLTFYRGSGDLFNR